MNGYLDDERLNEVQLNLKYRFDDIELLETALTHSSYANEQKQPKTRIFRGYGIGIGRQ